MSTTNSITVPSEYRDFPIVNFGVVTISDWDELLNEKSAISPWDYIFQLDSEYTVTDGFTETEVPAVSGIIQEKQETIGTFEIRPASGLVIGIDFKGIGLVHKIWTAFDSIEHCGSGGDRREWWNIPLQYGTIAEGHTFDEEQPRLFEEPMNLSYEHVQEYLFKTARLEFETVDSSVYLEMDTMYFDSNEIKDLTDISEITTMLERIWIKEKRRNETRKNCFN